MIEINNICEIRDDHGTIYIITVSGIKITLPSNCNYILNISADFKDVRISENSRRN